VSASKKKWIDHEALRHLAFWGGLYAAFVLFGLSERPSLLLVLLEEFINVATYALVVYFNFYVLIPMYLSKKKVFLFIGSLSLFLVLLTPILTMALKLLFSYSGQDHLASSLDMRIVFTALALVAFISTIFQILSEWFRHERDRRILEQQKTQSELRFLKSQINPHFLFNTLNNLYALTLKKSDTAPEIVLKLSDMMRYMLYECNEKQVLLSKELRYIENYIDLERIRQGKGVDIVFNLNGEIRDQKIAPMLLIPFIENSFKHGVNRQLQNAFVHLNIDIEDDGLVMNLINSKPDTIPAEGARRDGGIGLVNVKQQLQLLYPKKHKLTIEDTPVAYSVQMKIQF
jgi:LytS/YehU family sensor histidine kinase